MTQDQDHSSTPARATYLGLFMVALSTLMYEILLTRIFSVTMYYHFAFVAVSVAMFGMTVGAVLVYVLPGYFTAARTQPHLALSALLFSITSVGAFLAHLALPRLGAGGFSGFGALAPTYVLVAVPFVFSGVAVCLALTRYPQHVGRLYAADLAGAGLGCVALIGTLRFTDGPTAVVVVGALAAIGSTLFAAGAGRRALLWAALSCSVLLVAAAAGHSVLVARQTPLVRLTTTKGPPEAMKPLYEKWNSFSQITVYGRPGALLSPSGWGLSPIYPLDRRVRELTLLIDRAAGTPLTGFTGDPAELEHLRYDIVNLSHYLRRGADVLVVGAGGGRDLLSALAFQQKSVVGVEINENIIEAVTERFGDFTGHFDRSPRVSLVNDEARSYVARQSKRFDIIQISLIDTWAATAAGAFVLSENSLYTVEAWRVFLDHLTPGGIFTVSRWCSHDRPNEVYRVASLAAEALMRRGVKNPRDHVVIARLMRGEPGTDAPDGIGTALVSSTPFSTQDLDALEEVTERLGYEIFVSPRHSADETLGKLLSGSETHATVASYPLNISAPTDDNPFFFHMLRLKDVLDPELRRSWEGRANAIQLAAVAVLATLLAVVAALTLACILVPIALVRRKEPLRGALPLLIYFSGIGTGFMLVEVSQMQRLIVFLGHPTYALSVVLFSLLLSSGLGSYLTHRIDSKRHAASARALLGCLLLALLLFGAVTPSAVLALEGAATSARIGASVAILFGLGLFMGMPFPLGMKLAESTGSTLTPWLWGVNGATSVLASVLAVAIALAAGISASFWTGFTCYALAAAAFLWAQRRPAMQVRGQLPE